jgi:hypothetical protein
MSTPDLPLLVQSALSRAGIQPADASPVPAPFTPVPLPQASAPAPSAPATAPAPLMPAATGGGGLNWAGIIKELAPLVSSLAVNKIAGPRAATGFMQGLIQSEAAKEKALQEQAQLDSAAAVRLQDYREKKRAEGLKWLDGLRADLGKITSDTEYQHAVESADAIGSALYGFPPGTVRATYRYTGPTVEEQTVKDAKSAISGIKDLDAALAGDVSVVFRGRPTPIRALWTIAQMPTGKDGAPFTGTPKPEPKPAPEPTTPEGQFVAAALKAAADKKGAPLTPAEEAAERRKARTDWMNATPVRPTSPTSTTASTPDEMHENVLALAEGRAVPSMFAKRGAEYNKMIAGASAYMRRVTGKPYDVAKAELDYKAAQRWVTAANSEQRVRMTALAQSVVPLIAEVMSKADEMSLGGVPLMNRVEMQAYAQTQGNSPKGQLVAQYLSAVYSLREEFAQLVQAGYSPTEPAFKLAEKQVNENYGFKQLNASLDELRKVISFRVNALNNTTVNTLGGTSAIDAVNAQNARAQAGQTTTKTVMQGGVKFKLTIDAKGDVIAYEVVK